MAHYIMEIRRLNGGSIRALLHDFGPDTEGMEVVLEQSITTRTFR